MTNLTIWRPQLKFYHIYDDPIKTLKKTTYVRKGMSQNTSLIYDQLSSRLIEIYEGTKNTFMMDVLHRYLWFKKLHFKLFIYSAEFSCSFDKISLYPFGYQNCSFTFFSEQSGNLVPGMVNYLGSRKSGEYEIDKWYLTCSKKTRGTECKYCEVSWEILNFYLSFWLRQESRVSRYCARESSKKSSKEGA